MGGRFDVRERSLFLSAIVAIIRESHVVIPQLESVISGGDEILALSVPEAEDALRQAILGEG